MGTVTASFISAIIGLILFGAAYPLLKKTEEMTIKDKDYDGDLKEIKWSTGRLIAMAIIGAVSVGAAGYIYGLGLKTGLLLIFYLLLTIAAFVDARTMVIPFFINVAILVLGVISIWVFPEISLLHRFIGLLVISVPMMLINLICRKVIGRDGFGGGDVKLMFAAGFLMGTKGIFAAFFMGAIVGGIIGVYSMTVLKKKGKDPIPFGPSLCIGLVLASLFGTTLIDWYIDVIRMAMNPPM